MICNKCNKIVPDDAKFCGECGNLLTPINNQATITPTITPQNNQILSSDTVNTSSPNTISANNTVYQKTPIFQTLKNYYKENKKKSIIILSCVLALVIVLIALKTFSYIKEKKKNTVNVQDFVKVGFSGVDGSGEASCYLSESSLLRRLYEVCGEELDEDFSEDDDKYVDLSDYFEVSVDKESELSNGDTVTASIKCKKLDKLESKFEDAFIETEDFEYTVNTLTVCEDIDLFEDVTIQASGVGSSQTYKAVCSSKNAFINDYVEFSIDEKNPAYGDKVTVTATFNEAELVSYGYKPKTTEKEYTIDINNDYASDITKIDSTVLKNLANLNCIYCYNSLVNALCESFKSGDTIQSLSYLYTIDEPLTPVSMYLMKNSGISSDEQKNQLGIIYKATVHDGEKGDVTIYVLYKLSSLVINTDATKIVSYNMYSDDIDYSSSEKDAIETFKSSVSYTYEITNIKL